MPFRLEDARFFSVPEERSPGVFHFVTRRSTRNSASSLRMCRIALLKRARSVARHPPHLATAKPPPFFAFACVRVSGWHGPAWPLPFHGASCGRATTRDRISHTPYSASKGRAEEKRHGSDGSYARVRC